MAIKRYTADADTTITNAYKANLTTRGTGSNMGLSDVLTAFSIYGQASGSTDGYSQELSRILIKFGRSKAIKADKDLQMLNSWNCVQLNLPSSLITYSK